MATRGGDRRLTEHDASGLLTVTEAPPPLERPAPGERLRRELAELDERQGAEAQRRAEQRRALAIDIKAKTEERTHLLEHSKNLEREVVELRRQLDHLPDEASERKQRITDRLAAFGRVLRAEVHIVDDMLAAYTAWREAHDRWQAELAVVPTLEESRDLLEFHTNQPDAIDELPEVIRSIIQRRLDDARAALADRCEPARPEAVAPIYELVTPCADGGSVAAVVVPAGCDALLPGHPHALFAADVLAAMSQALLEETDADAPVLICPAGEESLAGAVVVGAPCRTDALDADLFGVRVQELLSESRLVGVGVQRLDDVDLAAGIGELVRRKAEQR